MFMLTVIRILFIIITGVLILNLIAKCVIRRQARRRSVVPGPDDGIHSTEPPKTGGLDPMVIAALPLFCFNQTSGGHDESVKTIIECAICLSNIENEEMARLLPNCGHTFHAECIDEWLGSRTTCPICRTEAEPRLNPEPRAGPRRRPAKYITVAMDPPLVFSEGTSNGVEASGKVITGSSSSSRLISFRRIVSGRRSSRSSR